MAVKTLKIDDICDSGVKSGCTYCLKNGISEHELPKRAQVEYCKEWLKEHFIPSEKWRASTRDSYSIGSYGLKHDVERDSENEKGHKNVYVTNGAFITAALELNFEAKRCFKGSLNTFFKIEAKDKTNMVRGNYYYIRKRGIQSMTQKSQKDYYENLFK